jgi:hypothetical protein
MELIMENLIHLLIFCEGYTVWEGYSAIRASNPATTVDNGWVRSYIRVTGQIPSPKIRYPYWAAVEATRRKLLGRRRWYTINYCPS